MRAEGARVQPGLRSGDGPLSVRTRPSRLKRDCARRATNTGGKGHQGSATATPVRPDRQVSRLYRRSRSTSQADSTTFFCLRRGLRLKDGPGSARAAPVSAWLRQGFILSPSARTGLADSAPRAKVGQTVGCSTFTRGAKPATQRVADGERMTPPRRGVARTRQYRETTSTRATRTHAVPFACPREAETRDTDRMPGTRQTTTDQGSGSRLQGARRPPKR